MFTFLSLALDINKVPGGMENVAGQLSQGGSYMGNLLVFGLILVIILIYGFLMDPHNMLISLISIYAGTLAVSFFPFATWHILNSWTGQAIIFLATIILTAIILSMTRLFRAYYASGFFSRWLKAGISGILHGGLFVAVILSIFPEKLLTQFSPGLLKFFTSETALFAWIFLPLLGLIIIRNKNRAGRPAY
jgi:hypothetical protein